MEKKKKDPNLFYKVSDQIDYRFFKTPKDIYYHCSYDHISLGAKSLYMLLADRLSLSLKNRMFDREGYVYVLFKITPAMDDPRKKEEKFPEELSLTEILQVSPKSIRKYKEELVNHDLLFEKRAGQGKANRIYVLKPRELKVKEEKFTDLSKERERTAFIKSFPALYGSDLGEVNISPLYDMSSGR